MIELHNCDCLPFMKSLPDKAFDLAICDPPYGIGLDMVTKVSGNKHNGKRDKTLVKHEAKTWNNHIPPKEYFIELHRISKHQIIWGCNYYAQFIPAIGRIVHDKMMSTEDTAFKWSDADLASCSLQRRITMFRYQWQGNKQNNTINWKNTGIDSRIHPTQKPVALYKWLLKNYAKPGQKIFDSHCGSGSILIACHDYNFDITACELDKDYYEAALKRLKQHQSQLSLI